MNEKMLAELQEHCVNFKLLNGLDDAIVGLARVHGSDPVVLYDPEIIIEILMDREGLTLDDAVDFYGANIECAYFGPGTPAMLIRLESRLDE
jgi:hypothetical protein